MQKHIILTEGVCDMSFTQQPENVAFNLAALGNIDSGNILSLNLQAEASADYAIDQATPLYGVSTPALNGGPV